MREYQARFLSFATQSGMLKFGDFKLKSGRQSPYFFDMGHVNTGALLKEVSHFYSEAVMGSGISFDVFFGPAYKGIPLATGVAMACAERGLNRGFCFNRKEKKDHGEGGLLVGAPMRGRILIIDDVITKGTATRESLDLIRDHGAECAGLVVAIDRQERGVDHRSAIQAIEEDFNIPVVSIVTLDDVRTFLAQEGRVEEVKKIEAYQAEYGIWRA
ncbi:MAG: orotate phosphoribosyltransferase [Gammaproteobacteria bacterium]|nr:orotate phosphoribosyltransferase [Gammaproteobacteria bacterium]